MEWKSSLKTLGCVELCVTVTLTKSSHWCQLSASCRLIVGVLRLCEMESQAVAAEMTFCLSPQVTSTAMWSLRRWAAAYLMPNENYYSQVQQHGVDCSQDYASCSQALVHNKTTLRYNNITQTTLSCNSIVQAILKYINANYIQVQLSKNCSQVQQCCEEDWQVKLHRGYCELLFSVTT